MDYNGVGALRIQRHKTSNYNGVGALRVQRHKTSKHYSKYAPPPTPGVKSLKSLVLELKISRAF